MRILLVEDDEILRGVLEQSLNEQRYVVDMAEDGQLGWNYAQEGTYDLLLIDVGLPRLDGITLCQRLRAEGYSTPILLMTAKDAPQERIRGLDAGADDYLTKPLDLGELQARVRALLRRGEVSPTSMLEIGPLRLDPVSCEVTYASKPLKLTPKEYSLLELFLRNPLRVFSRGQIVEHLWTFDDPPLEESVKAHIKGLRRKMKTVGAADWIENVYGIGYKLTPPTQAPHPVATPAPTEATPAPDSTQQAFNQAMGKLWEQYRGLMTERLEALQQAAIAIQSQSLSPEIRQTAAKAAHKLAGVLGMFDREAGTQLARTLETILQDEPEADRTAEVPPLVAQLAHLLNLGATDAALSEVTLPLPALPSRLLLISQNASLENDLQALTQSVGLGWHRVTTVEEGKSWLQTHTPDLVVFDSDGDQPLASGLPFLSELAARTPALPALVLTDTDDLGDRIRVASLGIQGVLTKPVTPAQLWETGDQILQRSRTQSVTVLAVDDDPILLQALGPMLEPWGIRVNPLDDPARFWQVLNTTTPDLVILDVEMPEFSGIELCQAVRTDANWQDLPIVFLTSHRDAETVQQVFAAGADDYVTKPILGPELLTRITNRLERTRFLQTLSRRDPKTGLDNQPHSSQELEQRLQPTLLDRRPLSFVLLTLPDLPAINERYGHLMGNQVLKRWGDLLRSALRGQEISGYWGYGEFVIGIPDLPKPNVRDRLAPLLTTLRKQIFSTPDGTRFQVNYSLGIAEAPTEGDTVQALYRVAKGGMGNGE